MVPHSKMSQCHWITNSVRCTKETKYNICPQCLPHELSYYNLYKKGEELTINNLNKHYNTGTRDELNKVLTDVSATIVLRDALLKQIHTPIQSEDRYNPIILFRALGNYTDRLYDIWDNNPCSDATIDQVTEIQKLLLQLANDPFTKLDNAIIGNINLARAAHNNWHKLQEMCGINSNDMMYLHSYIKELYKHLDKSLESITLLTAGGKVVSNIDNKPLATPPRINTIINMWNQIIRFTNQADAVSWYKWIVLFIKNKSSYTLDSYVELIDDKFTIIVKHEVNRLAVYWRVSHWDMRVIH